MAVLGAGFQYSPVPDDSGVQVVAPRLRLDKGSANWTRGRAGALLACCGAAALVALVGTIDNSATSSPPVLAMKDSLAAVQPDYMHRQNVPTTKNLAASAHSFIETANGIMQDVKMHANDFPPSASSSLASSGREMQLSFAPSHPTPTLAPVLRGSKLAEAENNSTAPAEDEEKGDGDEEEHPKVLGATGKDVFGQKNSTMVGFLGFSDKEPAFLGIPLPIVMFLFVLCACISCITVGCMIARKTDILKVNKEEAGAPARPVDEEPDQKGYSWREKPDAEEKT